MIVLVDAKSIGECSVISLENLDDFCVSNLNNRKYSERTTTFVEWRRMHRAFTNCCYLTVGYQSNRTSGTCLSGEGLMIICLSKLTCSLDRDH